MGGKRAGLIISEEEWQAKFAETNGKFVPYYSSGDGSSTFRTPLLGAYAKGAETAGDVGEYLEAGLPNIAGSIDANRTNITNSPTGALFYTERNIASNYYTGANGFSMNFDASLSNSIYGNSDTVQPPSIIVMYCIVAYGTVTNVGNADVAKVMQAVEQVQTGLGTLEQGVGTAIDYIIESYRNGTEWYEVYKSGKVRQGGSLTGSIDYKNFLNPYKTKVLYVAVTSNYGGDSPTASQVNDVTLTNFQAIVDIRSGNGYWIAEGV